MAILLPPELLSQVPSSQRINRLEGRGPGPRERARLRAVFATLGGAGRESRDIIADRRVWEWRCLNPRLGGGRAISRVGPAEEDIMLRACDIFLSQWHCCIVDVENTVATV